MAVTFHGTGNVERSDEGLLPTGETWWAGLLASLVFLAHLPGTVAAGPAHAGLSGGIGSSHSAAKLPSNGAAIIFGRSSGKVAGFCSRTPGVAPAYSVSLFMSGRTLTTGVPPLSATPRTSTATVPRLLRRAKTPRDALLARGLDRVAGALEGIASGVYL